MLACSARKEQNGERGKGAELVRRRIRAVVDGLEISFSLTSSLPRKKKKKINLFLQLTYSTFIAGLKAENIALNRKILSDFAEKEPLTFGALASRVRALQERGGGGGKAGAG